jgi:hypothetical protein
MITTFKRKERSSVGAAAQPLPLALALAPPLAASLGASPWARVQRVASPASAASPSWRGFGTKGRTPFTPSPPSPWEASLLSKRAYFTAVDEEVRAALARSSGGSVPRGARGPPN